MSELYDSLIEVSQGVKIIFEVGEEPREDNFYELTEEMLEEAKNQGINENESLYIWVPNNLMHSGEELMVFTEKEKDEILKAKLVINELFNKVGEEGENFNDKLHLVAKLLPKAFTTNTKYWVSD